MIRRVHICRLLIALCLGFAVACGGSTGGTKVIADGFDGGKLPDHATAKVKANHAKCSKGDPVACDWVGVWFLVGGGGQQHVDRAKGFFDFACKRGYRRGCIHLQQMESGDHKL